MPARIKETKNSPCQLEQKCGWLGSRCGVCVCTGDVYSTATFPHRQGKAGAAYSEKSAVSLCSGSADLYQNSPLAQTCQMALGELQALGNCVNGNQKLVINKGCSLSSAGLTCKMCWRLSHCYGLGMQNC